jgi:hypothetical protein
MTDYGCFLSCEEFGPPGPDRPGEDGRTGRIRGAVDPVGDGYITMTPEESMVTRFRKGGDGAKPVSGGTKVCYGTDRDEAVRTARRLWAHELLPGGMGQGCPRRGTSSSCSR